MKYVAFFMTLVAIFDVFLYGALFNVWLMPLAALLLSAWFFIGYRYLWLQRPVVEKIAGWNLGEGIDISNPEHPEKVKEIIVEQGMIDLGLLVVGSPSSGKTVSAGIGLMNYFYGMNISGKRVGFAWHDGKGDKDIYQSAVSSGVKFDGFFSSELPSSHHLNVFDGEAEDVIDRSVRVLINASEGAGRYYADEQRKALTMITRLLKCLPERTTYQDLFVALSVEGAGAELLKRAKETSLDPVDIRLAENWLSIEWKTRVGHIAGLLNRLFLFVSGPLADRLNDYYPDICLETALEKGQRLYFHLPLTELARDIGVLLQEMWGVEARKRQQGGNIRHTYPLLFDDWGGFFHDNVGPITSRIRSAKMPPTYSFQDDSHIEEVELFFKKKLENNIPVKIAFRTAGADAAESVSKWFGSYRATQFGQSAYQGRSGNSIGSSLEPRVIHDDLLSLNKGEGFLMTVNERSGQAEPGFYRVQFPLVEMKSPESIDWPALEKEKKTENGLRFWDRYMNPEVMAKIKQEVKEALLERLNKEEAETA